MSFLEITADYWSLLEITGVYCRLLKFTSNQKLDFQGIPTTIHRLKMWLTGCILWVCFRGIQLWVSLDDPPNISVETLSKVRGGEVIPRLSCECDEYHEKANGGCVLYVRVRDGGTGRW